MPESFNPDAWPRSSGTADQNGQSANPNAPASTPRRTDDFDDDYEALAFDDEGFSAPPPADSYGYDDDYSSTGTAGTSGGKSSGHATYAAAFDDDDYSSTGGHTQTKTAGSRDQDDFDDRYDDGANYDRYDDYDFDHEPTEKSGVGRRIIAALAVVFVIGAIGVLAVSLLSGGNDPTASGPDQANTQTQQQNEQASAAGNAAAGSPTTAPKAVSDAMNQALTAWGQFAADGNLETVRPYFMANGPQMTRLEADSTNIQAKPGPVLQIAMQKSSSVKVDDNNWLVKGTVVVGKSGEKPQNYPWEIRMARAADKGPWQVLTIRQY